MPVWRSAISFRASPTANPVGDRKKGLDLSRCRSLVVAALAAGTAWSLPAVADAAPKNKVFGAGKREPRWFEVLASCDVR